MCFGMVDGSNCMVGMMDKVERMVPRSIGDKEEINVRDVVGSLKRGEDITD